MNKLKRVVHTLREEWTKIDWENFAYQTVLACHDESHGIEACAHHLHAYEDQLQPELSSLHSDLAILRSRGSALHEHLYNRPLPASDAALLTHRTHVRLVFGLCAITAGACLVGNLTTFVLLGWSPLIAFLAAVFMTTLPVGLGHPAYERLVAGRKWLQAGLIIAIAALGVAAFYELGQARRVILDKATARSAASSYVDNADPDQTSETGSRPRDSETEVHGTLGGAAFLITMAAELGLAYLVGLLVKLRTDQDYAAWNELKAVVEEIAVLEERVAELLSRIKRAKRQCMAGIRRAQSARKKRRTPYHKALTTLVVLALTCVPRSHGQVIRREESTLIDSSASISRQLFREYVRSTRELLSAEPPNTRVWVSSIVGDSFGAQDIVVGWTPEVHGVFTDDLDRARQQLASTFVTKSSRLAPTAQATDIIGGLWHIKALFESSSQSPQAVGRASVRIVNIFSDMKNDSRDFSMPDLLALGPDRMLERVKGTDLLVPLPRYKVYVYGASTTGLTPRSWMTIKRFWELYFAAAGAELVTYSAECDVQR